MNQNSIPEEIKGSLKVGDCLLQPGQDLSSSSLLPKNINIKIYRTIILPVFYMGVKLGH